MEEQDGKLVAGASLTTIISNLSTNASLKPLVSYLTPLLIDKEYFDKLKGFSVEIIETTQSISDNTQTISATTTNSHSDNPFTKLYDSAGMAFRPDDLIMVVYRIISDTLKTNTAYSDLLKLPGAAPKQSTLSRIYNSGPNISGRLGLRGGKSNKYKKKQHKKTIKKRKNVTKKRKN
jgi:hypothetical protein